MRLFILILLFSLGAASQVPLKESEFRIYTGDGRVATLDSIIDEAGTAEVLFLGELHDDAVGHAVQAEIFRRVVDKYSSKRSVALSLEMFERDVQVVLDEYLRGQITESHFLLSSRPWGNYKTDYRPLVELAKEKGLSVIAANAPRRYVNMVSRGGRAKLDSLSDDAKRWLPKLPYAEPSAAYAAKFKALMGPSAEAQMGIDNILASQALWDASMADAIARFLKKRENGLVIHLNGSFHSEKRLGAVEHLGKYVPKARSIVITARYEDDIATFDSAKHGGIGDFVILTDAKVPRSKR